MLFSTRLLKWYDQFGRKNLPWQQPIHPYRVWVSEIMLQQTQVETVIPYFERFMQRFNSVQQLAAAPQDEVLHLWTGLGYYARARNLHKCAQAINDLYDGQFPKDVQQLAALPGIGPSTAAAISSIAYNLPTAILDGNVKRVLARHQAIAGWPGTTAVANALWQIAHTNMEQKRCRDYTQAIMDLGATLCTRAKPQCAQCPLQSDCKARARDAVAAYPGKKPRKAKPTKNTYMLLIEAPEAQVLLQKRPPTGIWGGLWCLPEYNGPDTKHLLEAFIRTQYPHVALIQHWQSWRHTFSHYHLDISPVHVSLNKMPARINASDTQQWYNLNQPSTVGLAAPVKRLLQQTLDKTPSVQPVLQLEV